MKLHTAIERSELTLKGAERKFALQRSELLLLVFSGNEMSSAAGKLLLSLEEDLAARHDAHRVLMEEAMRTPFKDADQGR